MTGTVPRSIGSSGMPRMPIITGVGQSGPPTSVATFEKPFLDIITEIERISGQVSTVNAIYRDLASLVGSQQDDVDEIEQLVAQSHDRTVKGQRQLERAVRKRTAKNKCCMYFACFLLFVIVVVVLAVLVLKTQY